MRILCIDLGGSRAKLSLVCSGTCGRIRVVPVDPAEGMAETMRYLMAGAKELLAEDREIDGIGFAFPGIVAGGRIVESNGKYPDAAFFDLHEWARDAFGCGIRVMNDAAAALQGELTYGVGRGYDAAAMMIIGTGVGTAAAQNGRVLAGRHGTMGILGGHLTVETRFRRMCTCGNRGCLEAWAGTWALNGLAREDPGFAGSVLAQASVIDYRAVHEGVKSGDQVCRRLFEQTVDMLGAGAVNLVHAYDPEVLILSGGPAHIPEVVQGIREAVEQYAWTPWGKVDIRVAENPEASVLLGLDALWEQAGSE